MTRVKICGITNYGDALHAISCGADAIGFNFFSGSSRYIHPGAAGDIIGKLPRAVDLVGVFVNEPIESIQRTAALAGLTMIQLHGNETKELVAGCAQTVGLPVIKVFRSGPYFRVDDAEKYEVDAVMIDAYASSMAGGTGEICDWQAARDLRSRGRKLYLAGGLCSENVADAISEVRPFAVDACSRLEEAPGRKDPVKVASFIDAAKGAL
jgi:phosphoribosylanthranilate isomerase